VGNCEVGCYGGALQHHGNCILRRTLRPGMAPYADALFTTPQPEPAGFRLHCFAARIQQFNAQRHIAGDAQVERSVSFNLRRPLHLSAP